MDSAIAGDVLMPGGSMTVEVTGSGAFRFLSLVGMLVTTNDAFYALDSAPLPRGGTAVFYGSAWDAGSEENTENCDHIPGPPCENPEVGTETSEGFVHIHPGIHDIGDLEPQDLDWRNPVVQVTVKRIS